MQYNDFIKLQDSVIEILKNYTYFLKKGFQLDIKYVNLFKEEIMNEFKMKNENTMLISALTMLNDNKDLAEVDKYIDDYKKNYNKELSNLNQKIINYEKYLKMNFSEDDILKMENHFFDIVKTKSPLLIFDADENHINAYEILQALYQQNNCQTYFAAYDVYKDALIKKDFSNEDFDKYTNFYINLMQKITLDTKERKNKYPFTKEEVFEDEITIAREKGDFRAKLNKLREANNSIKKDFIEAYGENVELD